MAPTSLLENVEYNHVWIVEIDCINLENCLPVPTRPRDVIQEWHRLVAGVSAFQLKAGGVTAPRYLTECIL